MPVAPRAVIAWQSEPRSHLAANQDFPRSLRLLKATEFEAVMNCRCTTRSRFFQVMGRPNALGHARLGMIVSKRVFSRSVDRNHMKRLIRETFRAAAHGLPALDLIVRPHDRPEGQSPVEDLHAALVRVADKCGAS
jgi:ribonuclease P protein component